MYECTDEILKYSVCCYTNAAASEEMRMVIVGHNYKSRFSKVTRLGYADEVIFTAKVGTRKNTMFQKLWKLAEKMKNSCGVETGI